MMNYQWFNFAQYATRYYEKRGQTFYIIIIIIITILWGLETAIRILLKITLLEKVKQQIFRKVYTFLQFCVCKYKAFSYFPVQYLVICTDILHITRQVYLHLCTLENPIYLNRCFLKEITPG